MNGKPYRLGCKGTSPVWERDEGKVGRLSLRKAFNKVEKGLEHAIGEPTLLVRPEADFNYGEVDEDLYPDMKTFSLGVLTDAPMLQGAAFGGDLISWISLPTEKYLHDFCGVKNGPMNFSCINERDVGVSDFERLETSVGIYVGAEAIEYFLGDSVPMGYFKGMNVLGQKVTDNFYSAKVDMIETSRKRFLKNLRKTVIGTLEKPGSLTKGRWRSLYGSALALGVKDRTVKLQGGFSFQVGEYLGTKI
jgi:hypothetical protein